MFHPNSTQKTSLPHGQREKEGLYLADLAQGAVVEIRTQHHQYRLVKDDDKFVRISGHPTYCPEPVEVEIEGSLENIHPLKANPGFIGRGMYLVLKHPRFDRITTSRIREIHEC
jgi:hypothetical protein